MSDSTYLDEQIATCLHREYFDLAEVETVFSTLNADDLYVEEIGGEIVAWTTDRVYCASDKFMNALLDIRNIKFPYSEEIEDGS